MLKQTQHWPGESKQHRKGKLLLDEAGLHRCSMCIVIQIKTACDWMEKDMLAANGLVLHCLCVCQSPDYSEPSVNSRTKSVRDWSLVFSASLWFPNKLSLVVFRRVPKSVPFSLF